MSLRDVGPFRPLRPFGEADRALFFGRERELGELGEKIAGERPSVLLLGESGVGKTSLVRAGLLPLLKLRGMSCAYIDAAHLAGASLPSGGRALLVLDDAGAALDEAEHFDQLLELLKRASAIAGLKVLFVVDDEDLWRLDSLEKRLGHVGRAGGRVRLDRLSASRAADLVERTVLAGGAYFEAGLPDQMATELALKGPVSPSELQLVAGTAVALRINTIKSYRHAGGAEVIFWSYFERACKAAGGRAATRALAEIAARDRRQAASLDAIARAADVDEATSVRICAELESAQLVRREAGGITLTSEWLRPHARAYTGEARGRRVSARLLLRHKIDAGRLLSLGELREVRQFAGTLSADEERVVRRSRGFAMAITAVVLGLPVIAAAALYGSYTRHCYLDFAGDGPGAAIVARMGRPRMALGFLPHRPPFGSVIGDSGFVRAALARELPSGTTQLDGEQWMKRLLSGLKPLPQGVVALVLSGEVKPLARAYEQAPLRPAVIEALGAAGRGGPEEIALLARALLDPVEDLRRRAVQAAAALEQRRPGAALSILEKSLGDSSAAVRALALAGVARLPAAEAAPALLQTVSHSADPTLKKSALATMAHLAEHTPAAAVALGRALGGPARVAAAPLLGRLLDNGGQGSKLIERALLEIAADPSQPEETRVDALKTLRHHAVLAADLAEISGSPRVMAAAMPLLVRSHPADASARVSEAMKGPTPMRAAAAAALALLPKGPQTALQLKILKNDRAVEVRVEAVRSLPALGHEALPMLLTEAKGGGAEVERAAIETIGNDAAKLGAPAAIHALETVSRIGRASTRRAAIAALGRITDVKSGSAAAALGRLVRDRVPEVRAQVVEALGEMIEADGRDAVAALRGAASDRDPALRRKLAMALGRAHDPQAPAAAKVLASLAQDSELQVRVEAVTALGALGAAAVKQAAVVLPALLGDREPQVRGAARRAARQLGHAATGLERVLSATFQAGDPRERADTVVTAALVGAAPVVRAGLADPDATVRRAAAENAGGLGHAGVADLVGALTDNDAAVRVAAVRGLAGARAADALRQAAASPDLDMHVAALEAIGEVGGPQAQSTLEAALSDGSERVRVAAAHGLGKLGEPAAVALVRALSDPARDVRHSALLGLGQVWTSAPVSRLTKLLGDETDADVRWAAALALVRLASTHADARQALDTVAARGGVASRLTADLARAFVGRADALGAFLRTLREGN